MAPKQKPDLLVKFGEQLSYVRSKKGMSLRHLSAVTHIDPSDIVKYEKGLVNPSLTTIGHLARGLGAHPRDLMDFKIDWPIFQ